MPTIQNLQVSQNRDVQIVSDVKTDPAVVLAKTIPARDEVICDKSICSSLGWKYNTKTQKYNGTAQLTYVNDDNGRVYLRNDDGLVQDQVKVNDVFAAIDAYTVENPDSGKAVSDGLIAIGSMVLWLLAKQKDNVTF